MTKMTANPNPAFFAWGAPDKGGPGVSVVAPMHNEAGGAASLLAEIQAALAGEDFEIIAVDDGSTDATHDVLIKARREIPALRILRHERNAGQSRALRSGILAARAPVIAMLDGDGQNDPADIPALLARLREGEFDTAMVAGERQNRKDTAAKRWASGLANCLRKRLLQDGANDTGCGLKVFYREAFLRLPYFDHAHRYLPALMEREGFAVRYLPVSHRARAHGVSKYNNFGRFLVAIRDLFGVVWLKGRSRTPGSIEETEF